jgi:hypothetical protein
MAAIRAVTIGSCRKCRTDLRDTSCRSSKRAWHDDDDSAWSDDAMAPAMGMASGMNHSQLVMLETTGDPADDTPARLRLLLPMGSTSLVNRCAPIRTVAVAARTWPVVRVGDAFGIVVVGDLDSVIVVVSDDSHPAGRFASYARPSGSAYGPGMQSRAALRVGSLRPQPAPAAMLAPAEIAPASGRRSRRRRSLWRDGAAGSADGRVGERRAAARRIALPCGLNVP